MPRFQFTIRGLLLATFWGAVAAVAWTFDIDAAKPAAWACFLLLRGWTPVVAVGALFGQTLWGAFFGFFVGMIWFAVAAKVP